MNPAYLGDSYDIVKRFFCGVLRELGYVVYVDPMFTGDWTGPESAFYTFLGAKHVGEPPSDQSPSALLIDPDTGINDRGSGQHATFDRLERELSNHSIVFAFDQSFSRNASPVEQMRRKLEALEARGCHALYYNSHARFLFVTRTAALLRGLEEHLTALGLPQSRLVRLLPGTA